MTPEIALVLAIVAGALVCFVTGILRVDFVALLVLLCLAVTGLVEPAAAVAGFSSPAVITMAGMFVIGAALARTGVASILGDRIYKTAGGETRKLIAVTMLFAGVLSTVINTVGLTAMMLPVVMDLARRMKLAPSQLLLPLVLGALLGSTSSLVGTPRNIVASAALAQRGYEPFGVFDFAPVGIIVFLSGVTFVALVGYRFLPARDPQFARTPDRDENLAATFDLRERLFLVRIPSQSPLDGKPLAASRLGSALGLHVVAILRSDGDNLAPGPATMLRSHDRLLVEGRPDLLREIQGNRHLKLHEAGGISERLQSAEFGVAEMGLAPTSALVGKTLADLDLRRKHKVSVLAIMRDEVPVLTGLQDVVLSPTDTLLVQGVRSQLDAMAASNGFSDQRVLSIDEAFRLYRINDRMVTLQVTDGSMLVGRTLGDSRLADAAGLSVVAIVRDDQTVVMPDASELFRENDALVVTANPEDLRVLRALQKLEIEEGAIS